MRALPILLLALLASPALGQCPPGATNCPYPQAPPKADRPDYWFHSASGNAPPWSTAVRIKAHRPGKKEFAVGSGTVIDGSAHSALIMTCAHVMRGDPPFHKPPILTVEIFGSKLDFQTGSVGQAIASFPGKALDRNDKLDVGLLTFSPGIELPASKLVPIGWEISPSLRLCSLGCSQGRDPTGLSEHFTKEVSYTTGYRGLECDREPLEGRSGGGLFDQEGRLCGVLDFASPEDSTGIYASAESLRDILRRNGLVEMADGPKKAPPVVVSTPSAPAPDTIELTPVPPSRGSPSAVVAVEKVIEKEAQATLFPLIASGLGGMGIVSTIFAFIKRPRPQGPPVSPPSKSSVDPSPEDALRLLASILKDRDEKEARKKSDSDMLDKIKSLLNDPKPTPNE
jgi:Trypsin-like peptidase domain